MRIRVPDPVLRAADKLYVQSSACQQLLDLTEITVHTAVSNLTGLARI